MKDQTIHKLRELHSQIDFTTGASSLSDAQIKDIVNIEYGQTLQSVVELFRCICRKYKDIR